VVKLIPVINTKTTQKLKERIHLLRDFKNIFQLDIADGKFTSWKTWNGPEILKKIKKIDRKFELHLMVHNPEQVLPYWLEVLPKRVIIHHEAIKDFSLLHDLCQKNETELAIAINPETPFEDINQYLDRISFITFLGVSPGPSGQNFQWFVLNRIIRLKKEYPKILCEVDGGINEENIEKVRDSGVDFVAIGSAIFESADPLKKVSYFQKILKTS
jgi:ribulose-phosphate 3-epimerase